MREKGRKTDLNILPRLPFPSFLSHGADWHVSNTVNHLIHLTSLRLQRFVFIDKLLSKCEKEQIQFLWTVSRIPGLDRS